MLLSGEFIASCMERIREVIAWGCEPYAQPVMKLNAPEKRPWVRHDWTEHELRRVQRWVNRRAALRGIPYESYDASAKTRNDGGADLFEAAA